MKTLYKAVQAVLMAGASFSTAAFAQSTAAAGSADTPSPSSESGDIVVTAQKRSESLSKVPMSITAVTGDQLLQKGISSVQDLVKLTPGLSYVDSGSSVPVFSLRGVGFFDTAPGARPAVTVYVDEAPLPFSIMASGAAFDLDHVEILKGPQGTLFGQNATGGAINYIAAKPRDQFGAGITASYARFNTADIQGYVTGPLSPDINVRLALRGVRSNGWQKSYTRHDSLGEQNFTQGRLLLDWQASDKLKLSLNLNGFIDKGDTQANQFQSVNPADTPAQRALIPLLVNYPVAPQNSRAADWDPGQKLAKDNKFYQATLRADYELSDDLTLTSLTSYAHMKAHQIIDTDGTNLTNMIFTIDSRLSSISQEVRLTGDFGPAHFIIGGNYEHDKVVDHDNSFAPYSRLIPATGLDYLNSQVPDTKAVFGNASYNLTDWLTIQGGARYTKADLSYKACTAVRSDANGAYYTARFNTLLANLGQPPIALIRAGQCITLNPNFQPGFLVGELNEDNISWRAGVEIKPSSKTLVYANASKGYKAGSVPVVPATASFQNLPPTQESVLAYEAGFKTSLADRLIDLNGAVFYYKYADKQLKGRTLATPNIFGPVEALINVPKSRVWGLEGQVSVYPVTGLSLTAAATYLNSKVTSDFSNYSILGQLQNFQGNEFPYTPKYQLVVGGQYKFPISDSLNGLAGADYNYRSKTRAGFGSEAVLDIKAYGVLDLRAGIEAPDGKWRVQAFGRNVANTYYWTNVAVFLDAVRRLSGPPATYGVQFGYKF